MSMEEVEKIIRNEPTIEDLMETWITDFYQGMIESREQENIALMRENGVAEEYYILM